jgi:hypothetical protein
MPRKLVWWAAWVACGMAFALAAHHYAVVKHGFFDDVFIYLHIARNAVESGTWQYFPVVDRGALLASSPLKLVLLTFATAVANVVGFGGRSLDDAQVVLLLAGLFGWLLFLPSWRGRTGQYAVAGVVYFLSATALASAFDFEGGLLFLWVFTLAMLLSRDDARRGLAVVLPLGGLIRPDLALLVYIGVLALAATEASVRRRLLAMRWELLLVAPVAWVVVALAFSVYPVPITYWTKAAIPNLVEQASFLERMFERIGAVLAAPGVLSSRSATTIGVAFILLGLAATLPRCRQAALVGTGVVVAAIALFSRMPASFWWYYDNLVLVVMAQLLANVLLSDATEPGAGRAISAALVIGVLALAVGTKGLRDQPGIWSLAQQDSGRAKGYLFLARNAVGDGSVTLPQLGRVLIKNPELGITSYFTGKGAWIWDGAGLAQPLDIPEVRRSALRYAYPPSLRFDASVDAQTLVDRAGQPLPVVEAWAMEDRDFDKARKVCQHVIVEGALCVNPFRVITPSR